MNNPLDTIICGDARHMDAVPDASVQLVVTSPPYNAGINYDTHNDSMEMGDYLDMLRAVWQECYRVLVPGGRIAVNVPLMGRQPCYPLNSVVVGQLSELLLMRAEIIWYKGDAVERNSTAWGSWRKASNPILRDAHEYVSVWSKGSFTLPSEGKTSGISRADFLKWTVSLWEIPPARATLANHPAPFPEELPRRLILLYTNIGDTVLDPFMGSGTTAMAAKREGRRYIGYDISEGYCEMARLKLSQGVMFAGEGVA